MSQRPDVKMEDLPCGCKYKYVKVPVRYLGITRIAPRRRRIMCAEHIVKSPSHRKYLSLEGVVNESTGETSV